MTTRMMSLALTALLFLSAPGFAQQTDPPVGGRAPSGGHFTDGHGGWAAHRGWHGTIQNFDHAYWRGGHWWHGRYAGELGWWWIVGPDWYLYPAPIYPYPQPFAPPGSAPGYWYWCDAYQQYYPFVGACPSGWRAVTPP